jgi:hypothetical protein
VISQFLVEFIQILWLFTLSVKPVQRQVLAFPIWQNGESFHLFVAFLSPFSVEGDPFLSQKGGEKIIFLSQIFVITGRAIGVHFCHNKVSWWPFKKNVRS